MAQLKTNMEKKTTTTSVQEQVYNLTLELAEQEELKKAAAAGFREEIKRIKAEIADLIKDKEEEKEEKED